IALGRAVSISRLDGACDGRVALVWSRHGSLLVLESLISMGSSACACARSALLPEEHGLSGESLDCGAFRRTGRLNEMRRCYCSPLQSFVRTKARPFASLNFANAFGRTVLSSRSNISAS